MTESTKMKKVRVSYVQLSHFITEEILAVVIRKRVSPMRNVRSIFYTTTELPEFSWYNISKCVKIYQIKHNIPNVHKIYQLAVK
jgi:hypothetical protein